jgi:hypothetical protein
VIHDPQIALPHLARDFGAVIATKSPETALDEVHGTARPVLDLALPESQEALAQLGCPPFIPTRAVAPTNACKIWNTYRQW